MTDDSVSGYLARGWSIVALHGVVEGVCTCGVTGPDHAAGKHPLYRNWQRIPIRELGVWQHIAARGRPTNVGLATGRHSGVFALDHDPKNVIDPAAVNALLAALPPTWSQRTGSGGQHWLFLMPADFEPTNSPGSLPKGLDIRGTGGQIVIAPSVTDKGPYLVMDPRDPVAAPADLLAALRPPPYTPRAPTPAGPITDVRGAAYAQRALEGLLSDLRAEASTRNERAYKVACRLHELINAEWLDYDSAYDAYLGACEVASANKPEPFGQDEAHRVWQNAAHHVGDKAAELPEATMGGTRLDFPEARTDSGASTPGLNTPLSPVYFAEPGQGTFSAISTPTDQGLNLPPDFWSARPVLKHIQLAAHARLVSADVTLYSVLTRLAALWPHQVRADTGVASPASMNLFAAVVGPSGAGKTTGVSVARTLLPRPHWLAGDAFADDRPLGSGEGIAEVFMGSKSVPKLDEHGVPLQDAKSGAVKLEKIRTQIRHNALMYAEEGESLARLIERSGSTIAETLRRAWSGGTLGQSNGRVETTRVIEEGSFSLALLIGFQLDTIQPLFSGGGAGTPQRFLYAWTTDPAVPTEPVPPPGPLSGIWPPAPAVAPAEGFGEWLVHPPETDLRPVTFAPAILAEIRAGALERLRDGVQAGNLDSHRPVTLVKLATLLAYLDCGRRNVTDEDWRLAGMLWDTSCRVRDHAIAEGRRELGKAAADKRSAYAAQEVEADLRKAAARDEREARRIEEVAQTLARYAQRHPGVTLTRKQMRGAVSSRDKGAAAPGRFEASLDTAIERQWVTPSAGGFQGGPVRVN